MTSKPTQYKGFAEKMFWVIVSGISAGIVALVGLVWGLTIDVRLMQKDSERRDEIQKQTLEVSMRNNDILRKKADDSTNSIQHQELLFKINIIQADIDRLMYRQAYGINTMSNAETTSIHKHNRISQ